MLIYFFSYIAEIMTLEENSDVVVHGFLYKLGGPFLSQWQKRYFHLFPNRLEWKQDQQVI